MKVVIIKVMQEGESRVMPSIAMLLKARMSSYLGRISMHTSRAMSTLPFHISRRRA
ncbi:hypothetical protein DUNSADRAFT_5400 [Dunaliella salina]|uniref:Uncharacterized protein n=1 Tax=Dunaliella salina TaxID=3046 RepID=A0ABQ7FUA9_DUNSA|nr:hypothetical protein DUNSADRAFT_5400 [Dunaliella salina]|eukprot:KAF5826008.1 hypothetical protein DUNSADRAFT_5400 [Dunaliella salina]